MDSIDDLSPVKTPAEDEYLASLKMYLRCLPGESHDDKVVVFDGPLALAKAA